MNIKTPALTPAPAQEQMPIAPLDSERTSANHSTPEQSSPRTRRRLRTAVVVVIGAAIASSGAFFFLLDSDEADSASVDEASTVRTVEAQQRDLVDTSTLDGTLRYANTSMVTSAVGGTVTDMSEVGDRAERNDVVAEVNAEPIVVFYGDVPMYRDLAEGTEGPDVEVLEQNLSSLGYHADTDADGDPVDTGFTVDGVFDTATTAAVLRWQEDLGLSETGTMSQSNITVTPGPSFVSDVFAPSGSLVPAGASMLTLNVDSSVASVYSEHTGEVELVPSAGSITSGDVLYLVDDAPIVAVVTSEEIDRDLSLGIDDGPDVAVVEQMLLDSGYDADGELEVDETFDEATADAVLEWKEDLSDSYDEVVVERTIRRSELIVVSPDAAIDAIIELPDPAPSGTELFSYQTGAAGRIVQTSVPVSDQAVLAVGTIVDIVFPGGEIIPGTVSFVSKSSTTDPTDPNADPQLGVEISLEAIPDSARELTDLDVDIEVVDQLAEGATVIPASALVATADGGFAVEVFSNGSATFVAVTPGLFADGFVEVEGIAVGSMIVVPS